MKIKYLSELGLLTMLLWLAAACSADLGQSLNNEGQDIGTETPISILSKLSVGQENQLSKLRVIIFSTRNSKPYDPKVLISNELVNLNKDYTTITYMGYNDIYVIGNEPVDLSGVKTPDDLKAIRMPTSESLAASEFVFYKQLLNVNVKGKNEIYLEGESAPVSALNVKLQHVIAKLTVNFDLGTEIIDGTIHTGEHVDFKSMELVRIPKYSSLLPEKYMPDEGYLDNQTFTLQNNSTVNNHFSWSSGEIYLPEHLLTDNKYRTILRINGISQGVNRIYTLPVGDGMDPTNSNSTDWNITRNRHYQLTIKAITGYGEEFLDVNTKVAGWSEINIPVEIPGTNFLVVSKQTVEVKSLRFYTYIRFASKGDEISITLPEGMPRNILASVVEYDDAEKKSGRIGFKLGNWYAGKEVTYPVKVEAGALSLNVTVKFLKGEMSGRQNALSWANARGYPSSANDALIGFYNAQMHKQGPLTGCKNYYSGTDPNDIIRGKGCWRLATINESRTQNLGSVVNLYYWTIEEFSATKAYAANMNVYPPIVKTSPRQYYCTLDVRPPELSDFIVSDKDVINITKADATSICTDLGTGWRLPKGKEMSYVFLNAGTNGLPNNFFSDSYWGMNDDGNFIVATMNDSDGSETTDAMRNQAHTVRCVKSRY